MKFDWKAEWQKNKLFVILGIACLINFIAHLCFYPALPEIIPTHWDVGGTVDGTGPKITALLLAALPLALLLLFRFVPQMDPKAENYEKFKPAWNTFVVAVTVFIAAISWITELAVFGTLPDGSVVPGALVGGGCGVLFLILGNYMPRIKQNYTFGCKTPWALHDEHNWNRTQRMGGMVFVVIGVVMLVCTPLLCVMQDSPVISVMVAALFGGIAWIYIYSYLVFKGKMK